MAFGLAEGLGAISATGAGHAPSREHRGCGELEALTEPSDPAGPSF